MWPWNFLSACSKPHTKPDLLRLRRCAGLMMMTCTTILDLIVGLVLQACSQSTLPQTGFDLTCVPTRSC